MLENVEEPHITIPKVFNECQKSAFAIKRNIHLLLKCRQLHRDAFFPEFQRCLSSVLVAKKRTASLQRLLRLVITFALRHEEGKEDEWLKILEDILRFLLICAISQEKSVRISATQLIAEILQRFPENQDLSNDAFDGILDCMEARLRDKVSEVRKWAALALARLVSCPEEGDPDDDPILELYHDVLAVETDKDVRCAILKAMPPMSLTMEDIVRRTSDIEKSVRCVAYNQLLLVPITGFSIFQRTDLLQRGLTDSEQAVRKECSKMLIKCWFQRDSAGDIFTLLKYLDVETHETAGELVIKDLWRSGLLDLNELLLEDGLASGRVETSTTGEAMQGAESFVGDSVTKNWTGGLINEEQALLWRVLCTELQADTEEKGTKAATARGAEATMIAEMSEKQHELLEKILPSSVEEFVEVITRQLQAGPEYLFSARQLLHIALLLDFADASGRKTAASLIADLLTGKMIMLQEDCDSDVQKFEAYSDIAADPKWRDAVTKFAVKVHSGPEQLVEALTGIINELANPCKEDKTDVDNWLRCLAAVELLLGHTSTLRSLTGRAIEPQEMLHWLIVRGAEHGSVAVRQLAIRCLGLYGLLDLSAIQKQLTLLEESLSDVPLVHTEAVKALFDIILWHGLESFSPTSQDLSSPSTSNFPFGQEGQQNLKLESIFGRLAKFLEIDDQEEGDEGGTEFEVLEKTGKEIVALGFAKVLQKSVDQTFLLRKLLESFFSSSLERFLGLRKCLSLFFRRYGHFAKAKEAICAVFVPIVKENWPGLAGKSGSLKTAVTARQITTSMANCMLTMLNISLLPNGSQADKAGQDDSEDVSISKSNSTEKGIVALAVENLAIQLSLQVLQYRSSKTAAVKGYKMLLCRALVSLDLQQMTQDGIKSLLYLLPQVEKDMDKEVAILKELKAFTAQMKTLDTVPDEPLSKEKLNELETAISGTVDVTDNAHERTPPRPAMFVTPRNKKTGTKTSTTTQRVKASSQSQSGMMTRTRLKKVERLNSISPPENSRNAQEANCGESETNDLSQAQKSTVKTTRYSSRKTSARMDSEVVKSKMKSSANAKVTARALLKPVSGRRLGIDSNKENAAISTVERKARARRQAIRRALSESSESDDEDINSMTKAGVTTVSDSVPDDDGHEGEDDTTPLKNQKTTMDRNSYQRLSFENSTKSAGLVGRVSMTSYDSPAPSIRNRGDNDTLDLFRDEPQNSKTGTMRQDKISLGKEIGDVEDGVVDLSDISFASLNSGSDSGLSWADSP